MCLTNYMIAALAKSNYEEAKEVLSRTESILNQGYYLGDNWGDVPDEVYRRAKQTSLAKWRLLFQLGPVASGDFEMMFGDGGNLYFYISKEDLLARRFERAWLISQCG